VKSRIAASIAVVACLWLFLAAQAFIPLLGMQNDEARFAAPIYLADSALYYRWIGPWRVPIMQASYVGTLKTLLWWPIFKVFGTSVWALREPAVFAGVATVWLFFLLMRRVAGNRAAAVAVVLLAADPVFVLTRVYDFGPHVLTALLLIAALLAGGEVAAFLVGLALWDKAIALWLLGGLGAAGAMFYWREICAVFTWRRAARMVLWLAIGASPLILYNVHSKLGTLRGNAVADTLPLSAKVATLVHTFDGSDLFRYLNQGWQTNEARLIQSPLQWLSTAITGHFNPHRDWMLAAFVLAILLAPFCGRESRRSIWFCIVAMIVAWAQMAWTTASGTSAHHTILLWPLPQAIMAISFTAMSRRVPRYGGAVLASLVFVLAVGGVLVLNTYGDEIAEQGGSSGWSDAIDELAAELESRHPVAVYCMDWGFTNNLAVITQGRLPLDNFIADDGRSTASMLGRPGVLFVRHARGQEFMPEKNSGFLDRAEKLGFLMKSGGPVFDVHYRPIFVIYEMGQRYKGGFTARFPSKNFSNQ